jgi:regulator of sirC expression with transglutaminase-like and TPR domain
MNAALAAFTWTLEAPDAEIDLARAALLLAGIEHESIRIDDYLDALDGLAARSGAVQVADSTRRLQRLREFLFEDERFRGNAQDYYDPRNSCLNDVLDRRLGIPITLSLVVIELGRRVGLAISGIGLPGHFIVGVDIGRATIMLDPFHEGRLVTRATCAELVAHAVGHPVSLRDEHFAPVTKRQLLVRMLQNLKIAYWQRQDWAKALDVIDRLIIADRSSLANIRDRGTVRVRLGDLLRGLPDWERYLAESPHAPDAPALRAELRRARLRSASLN